MAGWLGRVWGCACVCAWLGLGLAACGGDDTSDPDKGGHKPHEDGGADDDGGDAGVADAADAGGDERGGDGGDTPDGGDGGVAKLAAWTVFVYGHGDHSLSNSLVRDIVEMAQADIASDVNVIVLADFDASQKAGDTGENFPEGVQWLHVTGGGAEPELAAMEDELNLDDPDVLSQAVAKVFTNFPAKRRAVILWDHGGSWQGGFGGDTQDGTVTDVHRMTAAVVAQAVASGLEAAQIDDSPALDIFSFDACLMAGSEVAFELSDLAKVYIANAEIDYGDGWDYKAFLTHLSQHQDDSAADIGAREVELWDAQHANAGADDALLRSHVALDSARLRAFGKAFGKFSDALLASQTLTAAELGRASYFTLPQYMNQLESPGSSPELRDMGQFLGAMFDVSDAKVAKAAQNAMSALDDAIIAKSQGDLREQAGQDAFHVEFPLAATMTQELIASYREKAVRWNKASHWDDALLAYGLLNDGTGPAIAASISNGSSPDLDHLPAIELSTVDSDIAEVTVDLALADPDDSDRLLFFGIIGKGAITPNDHYQFEWNGQMTTLPDGSGGRQAAFVSTWEDMGLDASTGTSAPPVLATFGLIETAEGDQALSALIFQDGDQETSVLVLLNPPATLLLSQVATDLPGSTFTPVIPSLSISGGDEVLRPGTPIPLDVESFPLASLPAAAGQYRLVTSMSDVFGNASSDLQAVDLTAPIQ